MPPPITRISRFCIRTSCLELVPYPGAISARRLERDRGNIGRADLIERTHGFVGQVADKQGCRKAAVERYERQAGVERDIFTAMAGRQIAEAYHPVAAIATVERGDQFEIAQVDGLL